jgi:hypothetical protein
MEVTRWPRAIGKTATKTAKPLAVLNGEDRQVRRIRRNIGGLGRKEGENPVYNW